MGVSCGLFRRCRLSRPPELLFLAILLQPAELAFSALRLRLLDRCLLVCCFDLGRGLLEHGDSAPTLHDEPGHISPPSLRESRKAPGCVRLTKKAPKLSQMAVRSEVRSWCTHLTADERDSLVERRAAGTHVSHLGILVPDRQAAE